MERTVMKSERLGGLIGAALIGLGACAGAPKPTQQLADAQGALTAARAVGAEMNNSGMGGGQ
jgi:hypothetical protein